MVIHSPFHLIKAAVGIILTAHLCVAALAGEAPTITSQPQPQSAFIGASVNLRVAAIPSAALRYRWRFNGTNLPASFPGQFTSLLMITNARLSSAGPYSVVVSNSFGAVTSETAVVSINIIGLGASVGYVNLSAPPRLSLFNVPLVDFFDYQTVGSQMSSMPDGVSLFRVDGTGFIANNYLDGWSSPEMLLSLGEGWFFDNTTTNNLIITMVGEVAQGLLTNRLPAGISLCASLVPQAGLVRSSLGLPTTPGTEIFQFDPLYQSFHIYSYSDLDWEPTEPSVAVGEAFFVREPRPVDWIRAFTVNFLPASDGLRIVKPAIISETAEINFFTYNRDFDLGRVLDLDGTTPVTNNFLGQLYAATSNNEGALLPIGRPTAFLNGAGAGYIRSATIKLPGVTGGQTVYLQLRVWEKCAGDTYEAAVNNGSAAGRSTVFSAVARATLENGMPSIPPQSANTFSSFPVSLGPETSLRVARIQSLGSHVEICFATRPGAVYCLQKVHASGPSMNWTTVPGNGLIAGTGHVATVTDDAGGQQKFYRVCRIQ